MRRVTHYTEAEARDWFERLANYSVEVVRVSIPKIYREWPSGNCYEDWADGKPIGNVLHYTAGTSFAGTIRHFVSGNRASSNWVVAKALDRRFDALRRDLDLDSDLRAECVQVVPPNKPSWHAGFVNRLCTGIEVRNAGILRAYPKAKGEPGTVSMSQNAFFEYGEWLPEELNFFWWYRQWTEPFRGEVFNVNGSWWETWSRGSVATVITVLRYLNSLYPDQLEPAYLLAHHMVNPQKNDVALPLDLGAIRDAVLFSNKHVDDLEWLAELDDVEDGFEDADDPWMIRESDERQADRAEEDLEEFEPIERRIVGTIDQPEEGLEALRRLGFDVSTPEAVRISTRLYQRGRGIEVVGRIGPQTMRALEADLKRWRIL